MSRVMYGVQMKLFAGGRDDRAKHFQQVVDCYNELEAAHADLLDSSFGYSDEGDLSAVDVEVTVRATSETEAGDLAQSSVRSAIHAAGGATPDWEEAGDEGVMVYRLTGRGVELVAS